VSSRQDLDLWSKKLFEHGIVLVIRDHGKIVSMAAGYINDRMTKEAFVSLLVTLPAYTGRHYGRRLMKAFLEEAETAQMNSVRLFAEKQNEAANKLYHDLGFRAYEADKTTYQDQNQMILYL